jgi:hypothetical protein
MTKGAERRVKSERKRKDTVRGRREEVVKKR